MEFNKDNFKLVKITIIGMQGSGKTILAKKLIKLFKNPLVYGVYPEEWADAPERVNLYPVKSYSVEAFNEFAGELINFQKTDKKPYDCLFIDDADLFFKTNFDVYENINRLFISQRQLGLTLIFASKRPQNLSTKVYENSDYTFAFATEGINVKKYFENLHENMKMLLPKLSREKHNFILKQIGKEPKLFGAITN